MLNSFVQYIILFSAFLCLQHCSDSINYVLDEDVDKATVVGEIRPKGVTAIAYLVAIDTVDTVQVDPETGQYEFQDVYYGNYKIKVDAEGYGGLSINISVDSPFENVNSYILSDYPDPITNIYPKSGDHLDYDYFKNASSSRVTHENMIFDIHFSEDMNDLSLYKSLNTSPRIDDSEWEYYYSSTNRYLRIKVALTALFKTDKLEIALGEGALNTYGTPIEFGYKMVYTIDTTQYDKVRTMKLIYATSPSDNDVQVQTNKSITISFKTEMNKESVEKAFRISPELKPNFFWKKTSYSGVENLNVQFGRSLKSSTKYVVYLDAGFMEEDSTVINEGFSFSFKTIELRFNDYYPLKGATSIPVDDDFSFDFSFGIALEDFKQAFSITPNPGGLSYTYNSSENEITVHHNILQPETNYIIEVDSLVFGNSTEKIGTALTIDFTTSTYSEPVVEEQLKTIPYSFYQRFNVAQVISIIFPDTMDWTSVEGAFRITPSAPVSLLWKGGRENDTLVISPLQIYQAGTKYTLWLDSGYTSREGDTFLPFFKTFTTSQLSVTGYHPYNGRVNVGLTDSLVFVFNTEIDTSVFLENFELSPAVDSMRLGYHIVFADDKPSSSRITVYHNGFTPDIQYTIELDSGITDVYGSLMHNLYKSSFTTGN
ncbi:MAG: Ig-like domain-containing protein [Fibrobacteria bacterium]|nr:Ig-like domain-containing protein [Fibrobacteria bacterium]